MNQHGPHRPVDASFRPVRAATNVPSEKGPSGPPQQQETPAEHLDDHDMYTEDEVLVEQTQSQPQGTQISGYAESAALSPCAPTQKVVDDGAKRPREDRNPKSSSDEEAATDREILDMTLKTLCVLPDTVLQALSRKIYKQHRAWFVRGRQAEEIKDNNTDERPPRSFKSNADRVRLGNGSEALRPKMSELELKHQLELADIMAEAKVLEQNEIWRTRVELQEECINEQLRRIQHIVNLEPLLWNGVDGDAVKKAVKRQVQMAATDACARAAVHHHDETAARSLKQEQFNTKLHLKQAEELRNQTERATMNSVQGMLDKHLAVFKGEIDTLKQQNKKLQKQIAGKGKGGRNQSARKQQKWHPKGKGSKGDKGRKSKGQHATTNDNRFRSTVINLTGKPLNEQLESALGLGPGFRPTRKPTTDSEVGEEPQTVREENQKQSFLCNKQY